MNMTVDLKSQTHPGKEDRNHRLTQSPGLEKGRKGQDSKSNETPHSQWRPWPRLGAECGKGCLLPEREHQKNSASSFFFGPKYLWWQDQAHIGSTSYCFHDQICNILKVLLSRKTLEAILWLRQNFQNRRRECRRKEKAEQTAPSPQFQAGEQIRILNPRRKPNIKEANKPNNQDNSPWLEYK